MPDGIARGAWVCCGSVAAAAAVITIRYGGSGNHTSPLVPAPDTSIQPYLVTNLLEQLAGNHVALNLIGTLKDAGYAGIAVHPLQGQFT